jgi:hypothetical protein
VASDDEDEDDDNDVANQPGAGQERTGYDTDEEADDFVLYHVEEDIEVPAHLLHHNFYNNDDEQPFVMDLTEEKRQHAHNVHNGVGSTAV